jgi:hypothetical protein
MRIAAFLLALPLCAAPGLLLNRNDLERVQKLAAAERWAAGLGVPAYAVDDDTAIKVVDGTVEVVSEGSWTLFDR